VGSARCCGSIDSIRITRISGPLCVGFGKRAIPSARVCAWRAHSGGSGSCAAIRPKAGRNSLRSSS
jgi:hypothetical protein